ncbi:MAG: hypothetical protein C0507_12660 [Cyanobacteria bacterium PR.3.49]|jgi:2-polyprenyl-3-methyl-5-hydroxy-6-metoxy-1,4-benzoquinol methylase|nr:hypothetical protein [Cyanobacteria bacterium PR.3.49]
MQNALTAVKEKPPTISTQQVPKCALCGCMEHAEFAEGQDYELMTCANNWRFVRCTDCNLVRLNPRPSTNELSAIYPPEYYSYDLTARINPIALKGKAFLDALKFKTILHISNSKPKSYLDIGCGDGRYLKVLEKTGIARQNIYGIELSEEPVRALLTAGFRVTCERVEESTSIPENSIDLITMFHVIEHVADPSLVVERIANWLSKGGTLAIETPNLDSIDAKMFGKTFWGGYHIPRHWYLFSTSTLQQILEKHGLKVIAVKYQTGHSFWMYSLHHTLKYNRILPMPGLCKLFDPTKGLPALIAFTGLDILRRTFGFPTSSVLMVATKE